ncbi:MAG TPA: ABC transporter substrate-binding protein [Actinocatenispora sp.]
MGITRRAVLGGSAALATAALTAGCDSDSGGTSSGSGDRQKVNYLTSFGALGREAYAYVALAKGYFDDAGLDVTIKPGTGTGNNLKLIAAGKVDFSPCDFTGTLIQISKEKLPVTAVAAIHERSLSAIMSLTGEGVTDPKDLEGRTVADGAGSTNQTMFPVYAKLAGVNAKKVKWVNFPPPQLASVLAAGKVDAIGQFVVGQPLVEQAAKGKTAVVLPYSTYLRDLYSNTVFTSQRLAREKPDLVKKFTGALLKGLAYAVSHPDDAAKIFVKYQPTQNVKESAAELRLMAPYVKSASGAPYGALDDKRVARSIAILQGAGAIAPGMTPDKVASFSLAP